MNQKGIALIIAMCTVLLMGFTAQLFTLIIVNSRHNAQKEWNETSALYIAKAGANEAIRRLQKGDTITGSTTGNLLDGTYTYKSVTDGTDNWITSTGTTHGESQIVIIAYGTTDPASGGPGTSFDYAVFTDGKQLYKGGGDVHEPMVDGKVHSNNTGYDDKKYPDIHSGPHQIVDNEEENLTQGHGVLITFPKLNVRYDSTDSTKHYYDGDIEISNDYWHTATVGGTSNGDSNNRYYHDFVDEKATTPLSANMTTSPSMPTNGGVTLIISNSATPPTIEIDDGTGTLIIIGANAEIKGNTTFRGLIFIEKNKNNAGGDMTKVTGNAEVYGAIIARNLDVGAGTIRVYSSSDFQKETTKTDYDPATLNLFSWQAEY